jgi:Sec-independent protein translocase protein TatA
MFGGKIGGPEFLIVFAIAMLISGPSKLVGLGKSLRQGIRGF